MRLRVLSVQRITWGKCDTSANNILWIDCSLTLEFLKVNTLFPSPLRPFVWHFAKPFGHWVTSNVKKPAIHVSVDAIMFLSTIKMMIFVEVCLGLNVDDTDLVEVFWKGKNGLVQCSFTPAYVANYPYILRLELFVLKIENPFCQDSQ